MRSAAGITAGAFFATVFLATAFLAGAFLAGAFLAGALRPAFGAGVCAKLLHHTPPEEQGRFYRWSGDLFDRIIHRYGRMLASPFSSPSTVRPNTMLSGREK